MWNKIIQIGNLSVFATALICALLLSGCYKTGSSATTNGSIPDSPPVTTVIEDPAPTLQPMLIQGPALDTNCLNDTNGNICLFSKSPVAQAKNALVNDSPTSTEIAPLQTYQALVGDNSGTLTNALVRVAGADGQTSTSSSNSWKIAFSERNQSRLGQAMTFYWYNYVAGIVQNRTGQFWPAKQQMQIFVDDAFTGWSNTRYSIHLASTTGSISMAMDPSVLVYLMGIANAYTSTNSNSLLDFSLDSNHLTCAGNSEPTKQRFCCTTNFGCSRAIASGAGEYFLAMVFPDQPILAETIANNPLGIGFCGLSRNLNLFKNTSASTAFNACSSAGAAGQIHIMGALYASILWEIRKKSEAITPGASANFDRLFMQHLPLLRGEDNFSTAESKLLLIDSQNFSGQFGTFIREEFQRRGL